MINAKMPFRLYIYIFFFLAERTITPFTLVGKRGVDYDTCYNGRYYAALHNLILPRAPRSDDKYTVAIDCYLSPISYRENYRVPLV